MTLPELLLKLVADVLREGARKVWIAIRQRSKFEGWLKLELAHAFEVAGFEDVKLEYAYGQGKRADVSFVMGEGTRCFLELKTCNTNWVVGNIPKRHRPVTKNAEKLLKDVYNVKQVEEPDVGVVVSLVFPVSVKEGLETLKERMRRWKYGAQLLAENPRCSLISIADDVGVAVLLFGPYKAPRAASGESRSYKLYLAPPMDRLGEERS